MLSALIILLLFQIQCSLALSLPLGSTLPGLVKEFAARIFSHGSYVDQKVHQNPHSFLNHEQWHQRHVIAFTNGSSIAYVTVSAPTGSLGTMGMESSSAKITGTASLGSALSSAWELKNHSSTTSLTVSLLSGSATVLHSYSLKGSSSITGMALSLSSASSATLQAYTPKEPSSTTSLDAPLPSVSATDLQATSLASLLDHTKKLQAEKSADWDDETESACSAALVALHGVASNPSGIAACYNILSLDQPTGKFEVDLRLYRISAPMDGWLKLNPSSVGVGLTYTNATVSATKAKQAKREDHTQPWFPAQRDEAADIYIRRSTGVPPRRLASMKFVGTVDEAPLAELKSM